MPFHSLTKFTILLALVGFSSLASAENVEMTLSDELDGDLNSYCLDMRGYQTSADPAKGLQAHTCYSYQGSLAVDQIYDTDRFADGILYLPNFDVCATLSGLNAGANINLAKCDGQDLQKISLTDSGKLSPASAMNMCFTVGKDTRLGRGGTSQHQIKSLSLQACSDDLAAYQTWRTRTKDD